MRYDDSRFLAGPNRYALAPMAQLRVVVEVGERPGGVAGALLTAAEAVVAADGPAGGPVVVRAGERTISVGVPTPNRAWAVVRLRRLVEAVGLDPEAIGPEPVTPWSDESEAPAAARVPTSAITGTNGKSTTTRLLARMMVEAGRTPGVTTSDGVWVGGRQVLDGDFTGPQGAARALAEPGVDVGVLEVARGGLLLKGLGLSCVDVGVVTNVAADHLGLDGVETVEELAVVKGTVLRAVRAGGRCVVNAGDPWAAALLAMARAPVTLVCRDPNLALLSEHVAGGGAAAIVRDGRFAIVNEGRETAVLPVAEAPATLGGVARHNVENALAAMAAAVGLGAPLAAIRAGLAGFRSSPEENPGRLNVFPLRGRTVIVDFAHNAHGLAALLDVAEGLARPAAGRVWAVIGTAGDRRDEDIRALTELAVRRGAEVVVKQTERYLRGRALDDLMGLYLAGVAAGGDPAAVPVARTEVEGVEMALAMAAPGDVVAVMCQEQRRELWAMLGSAPYPPAGEAGPERCS